MTANRPHYHVWKLAKGDRAIFMLRRGFHTRQNARKYALRRDVPPDRFIVRPCEREACKPPLD